MGQHYIESIDSAQKENLVQLIHKLDDRGKEEDELLDEYRNLNDEYTSIGRVKLPDDKSLFDTEEV